MAKNIHKIYFTRNESNVVSVWQYDKGQILEFDESFKNGTEVQFEDGAVKVIFNNRILIPDLALEKAGTLNAWIQLINAEDETTIYHITIVVKVRAKKNDYVSPDDEQSFREEVQQMIEEAGRPTPEEIDPIVKEYLEQNPPAPYDDSKIKADISALQNDKQNVIADLDAIRSGANKGATALQSVPTEYAKKSDIPSLTDYAKKSELPVIPQNVSAFQNDSGYLTEHQDISGKANVGDSYTKTESDNKYALKGEGGGGGTTDYNALSNRPQINGQTLSGNKSLADLGINNLSTSDVDSRVQTYWNSHKEELKGAKGDTYTITSADYDAIADVVLTKLPSAESEEF